MHQEKMWLASLLIFVIISGVKGNPTSKPPSSLPCPANTSLTLISTPYPREVFLKEQPRSLTTDTINTTDSTTFSLNDLDGFSVEVFSEFLRQCPGLNVTLRHYDHRPDFYDAESAMANNSEFPFPGAILNMRLPRERDMTRFQLSQPVAIFPGLLVYVGRKEAATEGLIFHYATVYCVMQLSGSLVLFLLIWLERKRDGGGGDGSDGSINGRGNSGRQACQTVGKRVRR